MIVACAGDGDEDGGQEDVDRVRCEEYFKYCRSLNKWYDYKHLYG